MYNKLKILLVIIGAWGLCWASCMAISEVVGGDVFQFKSLSIALINYPYCENSLKEKALQLANGTENETETVLKISNWVSENIKWDDDLYCKRVFSVCETLIKKCGACGEKADLVSGLLNSLNISSVSVETKGEDHTTNEALINKQIVFLDASGDKGVSNFNMSKKDYETIYNKNISSMMKYFPNGTRIDITMDYTDTRKLNLLVLDTKNKPISNVFVVAQSHFLMEQYPDRYHEPKESTYCVTDESGLCSLNLGENDYTFTIKYGLELANPRIIKITEGEEPRAIQFVAEYTPNDILVLVSMITIVTMCVALTLFRQQIKRNRNIKFH